MSVQHRLKIVARNASGTLNRESRDVQSAVTNRAN